MLPSTFLRHASDVLAARPGKMQLVLSTVSNSKALTIRTPFTLNDACLTYMNETGAHYAVSVEHIAYAVLEPIPPSGG